MKRRKFLKKSAYLVFFLLIAFHSCSVLHKTNIRNKFLSETQAIANEQIGELNAQYSFVIQDLSFLGSSIAFKERERFPAASLIKLPILAAAFRAIDEGRFSLETRLTIDKKDVVNGSGRLKKAKLPITLRFEELLELMITISDNTAANKVIEALGLDYINDTFKKIGLSSTLLVRKMMDFSKRDKGIDNYTSSLDIAYLYKKIYSRKLIREDLSNLALRFLKKQEVNDRIPCDLPKDVIVAHKTGLERGIIHDAGIVFTKKGDYIICVLVKLSKKVKTYKKAKKFIAQVSLLAYNLYQ